MKVQTIGTMIDTSQLGCRDIHIDTSFSQLRFRGRKYICWGADRFQVDKKDKYGCCKWYRFFVRGAKHNGWVYIELNGLDLYNVYYTSQRHRIKMVDQDVYGDELCDRIDETIEKQEHYSF